MPGKQAVERKSTIAATRAAAKNSAADQGLRQLARQHHIYDASLHKTELIRKIQFSEGYSYCYATAGSGECKQLGCAWREDCLLESSFCNKTETKPVA